MLRFAAFAVFALLMLAAPATAAAGPPQTTITSGPSGTTTSTSATFAFKSSQGGSTFRCSLDNSLYASCTSPKTYGGLSVGSHTFRVYAVNKRGVADATPATRTWTVAAPPPPPPPDTTPPETTITSGPPITTTSTDATFQFTSSEANSSFQCRLDGGTWIACVSPKAYSGLSVGAHTVEVAATDPSGNTDASPAIWTWTVEAPPPPPPPACSDTLDNDSDGKTDYPADQGCADANDDSESPDPPQCSDRLDNDGDGLLNLADPGCADAQDDDEADPASPPPPADPTIAAAGDIADSGAGDTTTAGLVSTLNPTKVLTLGDNAYPDGTAADFASWYQPTWGAFKSKTSPAPGNHEYHVPAAQGYFDYFGTLAGPAGRGYYSFDIGGWHIISLNSEVAHGVGSLQETWLKDDLAASSASCTLAYWHKPRWTSGADHPNDTTMAPFVKALYDAGAEVILNGHAHQYERFAPMTPSGQLDTEFGVREFVVGTGGRARDAFLTTQPNSEVRDNSTWGVIQLTLREGSYDWSFKPSQASSFTDNGSRGCHGRPPPPP